MLVYIKIGTYLFANVEFIFSFCQKLLVDLLYLVSYFLH